jgi:serine/threonine-protein kinase
MANEFDEKASEAFIRVVRERKILSDNQANHLLARATAQSMCPSQIALQTQLMSQVEVEIAEAFVAPLDLAPGYELLDVLGHGALGVVYRARQPGLQRDVAIKAILQSRLSQQNVLARFEQEGAVIGRLNHPNIVRAFDSGSHQGRVFLVMELVPGKDLRQQLQAGSIPVSTAMSVVRQTAAGLSHALSFGVIHRDIKPGNLILTDAPAGFDLPPDVPLVKVADFGLARFHRVSELDECDATDPQLTMAGATLGTPMYSAPEQLTGDEVDHRADIYGLGATLFQAIAGETPFESGTVSKMMAKKITGEPPRFDLLPKHVNAEAKQLLSDMMAQEPEARIPDYETLIDRIDQIQSPNRTRSRVSPAVSKSERRTNGWLKPIAAAVLLVAALGYATWSQRHMFSPDGPGYVETGWAEPMFDGETVTGWGMSSGERSPHTRDAEGANVLRIDGWASRSIPLPDRDTPISFAIQVNVDLLKADSAEIQFGFQASTDGEESNPREGERMVAHFSRDAAILGTRKNVDGELVPLTEPAAPPRFRDRTPEYHTIRIELTEQSRWAYFLDGKLIGQSLAVHDAQHPSLLLATEGPVHFEGLYVYELVAKSESAP